MNRFYLLSLGVFLTSCASSPPAQRLSEAGISAPSAWSSAKASQAPVDTQWVRKFSDPTLSSLVSEALAQNQDLKIAAERVKQATAQARAADSAAKPQLNAGMAGSRAKRNFIGFPLGPSSSGNSGRGGAAASGQAAPEPAEEQVLSSQVNTFGPSLDISWELDVWGRVRAGKAAALAQAQAAEWDFAAAKASLAAQVAKAYFALAEAGAQLELSQETLKTLSDTESAVAERFKAGQAEGQLSGAQLRLARSDVEAARAQVEQSTQTQDSLKRQLETLLGRYPSAKVASAPLPSPPSPPAAGLPSDLLLRRPDIRAAERRYATAGSRIKEAKLAIFPQFRLTASTGTSSQELRNIINSDFGVWTLAGNIVQPILTGGRVQAEVSARQSSDREALASLHKIALQAFSEVETALAAESLLIRRETALAESARLAAEADDEARAAYRTGVGDILTVFQSQQRRLQAQSTLLTVRRLRLDTRINLYLALGGDVAIHP